MVLGVVIVLGSLLGGLGGVVWAMLQTFEEGNPANPAARQAIESSVHSSLRVSALCMMLVPVGLLVFVVSLIGLIRANRLRPKPQHYTPV
jgi:ABC-type lipoprotein release transport system permease subunit